MPASLIAATFRRSTRRAILASLLLVAGTCQAATYIVGVGSGCTQPTLAAAISAAAANPGANTIRLTRSTGYTQVAATITTGQTLDLVGGFATCAQTVSDGIATVLDGAGGVTEPVLRINGNSGAIIRLDTLTIRNGDEDGAGYGGGIYFRGNGVLEIQRSTITANKAGYGGGIYAEGTGDQGLLRIGASVLVSSNTARYSGGGIYLEGIEMDMRQPGSTLAFNTALGTDGEGGYGGGLMMLSGAGYTEARIDTLGQGNIGAIVGNEARYGGGVAVYCADGVENDVEFAVVGTDAQQRVAIRGNTASIFGGAIYARPDTPFFGQLSYAKVLLRNFSLVDNAAADGAAVYLDAEEEFGATLRLNTGASESGARGSCPSGVPCGEIRLNQAYDGSQQTDGAIIRMRRGADLLANTPDVFAAQPAATGVVMHDNSGGRLIYASDDSGVIDLFNVLASDNELSQEVIRSAGEGFSFTRLRGVTIAGNVIGTAHVIAKHDDTELDGSIIWQPGKISLQSSGGSLDVSSIIASEAASLGGGAQVLVRDPRFTDPARGDYTLRAASPAVDAALVAADVSRDMLGLSRPIDLAVVANRAGPRDIGAYERQTLMPLMLNIDFDADLDLWSTVTAGVTTRDTTFNVSGTSGSGSAKVSQTNVPYGQAIPGIRQCVHLPGPGTYTVNGWGRGTGNMTVAGDIAQLHWDFRRDGGEACTQGTPVASGDLTLANSASWRRPSTPAFVTVSAADWTSNSSISVTLVGIESGASSNPRTTNTWFDGVTIELVGADTIFEDGFD